MLFAVASALVNCTNSYDYEEPDPKMVELAKYAKQHVPEQHPKVRAPLTRGTRSSLLLKWVSYLCIHVRWFVPRGGPPSPCPVSQGPSAKLSCLLPRTSRLSCGLG